MARKPPLRLAYLISRYPCVHHTFVLREIRGLRRLGLDIRVASIRRSDRPTEKLTPEEAEEASATWYLASAGTFARALAATLASRPVPVLACLVAALRTGLASPRTCPRRLAAWLEAVAVGWWMQRNDLHHLHTHFASTVALYVHRMFGISFSMTLHGPDEFESPVAFQLAEKIQAATFACAISRYGKGRIASEIPPADWDKLHVVPLGIDPAVFAPRPFRPDPSPIEILCVGRLAPVKGHVGLIRAVHRLRRWGKNVRLRLVGDGPERERLERTVRDLGLEKTVVFDGWRNADEVLERYRTADIFALASFKEGVPVVLMEAMAMEIPCIASRINGIPELIRHETDGLLVSAGDDDELTTALLKLIDDPLWRHTLGQAGRRRVVDRYNLDYNVFRLAETFRRRIPAPSPPAPAKRFASRGGRTTAFPRATVAVAGTLHRIFDPKHRSGWRVRSHLR